MSQAWRDITGEPAGEDLEVARMDWLRRTADPADPDRHDFASWPRDVLAYHIKRKADELPFLRNGCRVR